MEVRSDTVGTVWKVTVQPGQQVNTGDTLVILECMKVEIFVPSPAAGTVKEIVAEVSTAVREGDLLVVLEVS